MEQLNDFSYAWTDAARAMAQRLDLGRRASELISHDQPPLLFVNGADDAIAGLPGDALALAEALKSGYDEPSRVEAVVIPRLGHALADEPGNLPLPQTAGARQVDAVVVAWLKRWLPT